MKVTTSKSKNSESFYIARSFINNKGKSTSVNLRKPGTLKELLVEHGPTRDDVMRWAKEKSKIETIKYKKEQKAMEENKIPYFKTRAKHLVPSINTGIARYFILDIFFVS